MVSAVHSLSNTAFTYQMSLTERLYTVKETAEILKVQEQTLRRWIKKGTINVIRLPGGRYRLTGSEVARLLQGGLMNERKDPVLPSKT